MLGSAKEVKLGVEKRGRIQESKRRILVAADHGKNRSESPALLLCAGYSKMEKYSCLFCSSCFSSISPAAVTAGAFSFSFSSSFNKALLKISLSLFLSLLTHPTTTLSPHLLAFSLAERDRILIYRFSI